MKTMADKLYELRTKKGVSQNDVAEFLGITRTAYAKYESGASRPVRRLNDIANYFQASIDYLLGNEGNADEGAGYYNNPETAELADRLKNQEGMRILFDASRNAKPEDLKMVAGILNRLKGEQ